MPVVFVFGDFSFFPHVPVPLFCSLEGIFRDSRTFLSLVPMPPSMSSSLGRYMTFVFRCSDGFSFIVPLESERAAFSRESRNDKDYEYNGLRTFSWCSSSRLHVPVWQPRRRSRCSSARAIATRGFLPLRLPHRPER